ncbi:MAG TPA: vWA domain-containing protein [Thermoplasmata archaeon]|nr:vWA domain-containing protein [Thermoplasmata archaeon]
MPQRTQPNTSGAASALATLFLLVIVALIIGSTVAVYGPARMKDNENAHAGVARTTMAGLRAALLDGSLDARGRAFTFPLGTEGVPALVGATRDTLTLDSSFGLSVSYDFVYSYNQGSATTVPQDVVFLIDSSGSMAWNDPRNVRRQAAKDYIDQLVPPDRVAIVDFDSIARLTRANVRGGVAHHLTHPGHVGPNYTEAKGDADTIDSLGGTNFASAIGLANAELANYGVIGHNWIELLVTDGRNNYRWQDTQAVTYARDAARLGITIFTIGLGDADGLLLGQIANITRGTYYRAATAEDLRWIYLEISRRYAPTLSCASDAATETAGGSLAWYLANSQLPPRTLRLEGGGLLVEQADGQGMIAPPPFELDVLGDTYRFSLPLLTLEGRMEVTGSEAESVAVRSLGAADSVWAQARPDPSEDADTLNALLADIATWARDGKARNGGDAHVAAVVTVARDRVVQFAAGETPARAAAARDALTSAAVVTRNEGARRDVQPPTADATATILLLSACRLTQWEKWEAGVLLEITTRDPGAWKDWMESWLGAAGFTAAVDAAGSTLRVRLNRVSTLELSRAAYAIGDAL